MTDVVIQSLPDGVGNATRLASLLGIPYYEIALHWFPDNEIRVTVIATGFNATLERQARKTELKDSRPLDYIGAKLDLLERPAYQRREEIQKEIVFDGEVEPQFFNTADADDLEKPAFLRKQMD